MKRRDELCFVTITIEKMLANFLLLTSISNIGQYLSERQHLTRVVVDFDRFGFSMCPGFDPLGVKMYTKRIKFDWITIINETRLGNDDERPVWSLDDNFLIRSYSFPLVMYHTMGIPVYESQLSSESIRVFLIFSKTVAVGFSLRSILDSH